jgi:hypothetical protein
MSTTPLLSILSASEEPVLSLSKEPLHRRPGLLTLTSREGLSSLLAAASDRTGTDGKEVKRWRVRG